MAPVLFIAGAGTLSRKAWDGDPHLYCSLQLCRGPATGFFCVFVFLQRVRAGDVMRSGDCQKEQPTAHARPLAAHLCVCALVCLWPTSAADGKSSGAGFNA